MKSKIRVLDELTINQIAAGEVIENPASVVKELVDNSIDSGATEISVEILTGGRQLIRITDNGCGMSFDDAILSFERHATSKIKVVDDINLLYTMGFRGEAVPSIASISKYTLLTRPHGEEEKGSMVIVDGGRIIKHCEAACAPGTIVEVKSLFFNMPVRKKFQRSPQYDTHEILKMLSKLALAYPEIKFELTSNYEQILLAKKSSNSEIEEQLKERLIDVLGSEFLNECVYIQHQFNDYEIKGFIGLPAYTKHNRSSQYLFINKRPVFSPLVQNAIREGYGTTLQTNRHPGFVIYLTMPGDLVDVNVHPQKKEVRLRQEGELKKALAQAVDKALHSSGIAPVTFCESERTYQSTYEKENVDFNQNTSKETFAGFSLDPEHFFLPPVSKQNDSFFFERPNISFEEPKPASKENFQNNIQNNIQDNFLFETLDKPAAPKLLGTIPGYILLEPFEWDGHKREGLCLMDQKAAHSRIVFENIKQKSVDKPLEVQSLLVPYTLSTTSHEASALSLAMDQINALGIQIKEFGKNTFIIDAVPVIFGSLDIVVFAKELIHSLLHESKPELLCEIEKRLAMIAARSSISTKLKLSNMEAQSLINKLFNCSHPYLCPLGKPVIVNLGNLEIAALFK